MTTPKKRLTVIVLALLLYLAGPLREWFYLSTEQARGSFPVDSDSIALGLVKFGVGWAILAPFFALILWLSLRLYPGAVPLFGLNGERPYRSVVWSMIFAVPIFYELFFAAQSVFRAQPLDVAGALLITYLLLCLRSSIVYRRR